MNASWHGDFIRRYHDVNVGVAVQTPIGLMVPVLRNADNLGLRDISGGVKSLAAKVVPYAAYTFAGIAVSKHSYIRLAYQRTGVCARSAYQAHVAVRANALIRPRYRMSMFTNTEVCMTRASAAVS